MTPFQGQNGTIVIEAESAEAVGNWRRSTVEGETVLLWDAPTSNYRVVDPAETLSYNFVTNESGNYFIGLNSARVKSTMNAADRYENGRNGEERRDTGNDVYVSIVDVESGQVLRAPTKLFTFFGDSDRTLNFGSNFDTTTHFPATVGLQANREYRLEITGRSDGYALDLITLNKGSLLRNDDVPQSPRVDAAAPPPVVPAPNAAPIARDDTARTDHDETISVNVLGNDRDPDGGRLTISDVSYDGNTSVVSLQNGRIVVDPLGRVNEARVETITYTVRDQSGATDTATLQVRVAADATPPPVAPAPTPANNAPVARNDTAETVHNRTVTVDVLANDRDADRDTLRLTDVSYDGDTSIVTIENGAIVVNPLRAATNDRTETITYTVRDGNGGSDTATLSVNVAGGSSNAPAVQAKPDIFLTAINAEDDAVIGVVGKGGTLNVESADIGLNFAVTVEGAVGSMQLSLNGGQGRIENFVPYAVFGNNGSAFGGRTIEPGDHSLSIKVYSEANGGGELLREETFNFSIAEGVSEDTGGTSPIFGMPGINDRLIGTTNDDVIDGQGGGLDIAIGGDGNDIFVFTDIEGSKDRLRILDYEIGQDRIDLGGATVSGSGVHEAGLFVGLEGGEGDGIFIAGVSELNDLSFV